MRSLRWEATVRFRLQRTVLDLAGFQTSARRGAERTPLLGVGMDSAPLEPQPQTTTFFRKSWAPVLTGPPSCVLH